MFLQWVKLDIGLKNFLINDNENMTISVDDFRNSGWREVLQEASNQRYLSMSQQFCTKAKELNEKNNLATGKVFALLSCACSMMLKPDDLNNLFAPSFVMNGERSTMLEDFDNDDIDFFAKIIPLIDEPKLCARISDIAWTLSKPRNPEHALSSIDNYRRIAINKESWFADGRECWDRAIQLCLMLGAGAGERLVAIESDIVEALKKTSPEDEYFPGQIAFLLSKHTLGDKNKKDIAEKLAGLAEHFESAALFDKARCYFDTAAVWYKKSENSEQEVAMIVRCAECWFKDGKAMQEGEPPNNMVARHYYECAIHTYRTIPKKSRDQHNVERRMDDIKKLMSKAGGAARYEMKQIPYTYKFDVNSLEKSTTERVRGKDVLEALLNFANLYQGAQVDELKKSVEETGKNCVFTRMFTKTYMELDGRKIAERPGIGLDGENQEEAIYTEMINHHVIAVGFVVKSMILPALQVIRQEHRLTEGDFYSLVKRSPLAPPDRANIIAKALYQGFDGDFVSALHILVPQIENLVRYHLKQYGERTTNMDSNGIENESGLSTLMNNPKVEGIFRQDFAFELKTIFCDPRGPNLRNELAHGLIGLEESQSVYSIYAWWLMFRSFFNSSGIFNDVHS